MFWIILSTKNVEINSLSQTSLSPLKLPSGPPLQSRDGVALSCCLVIFLSRGLLQARVGVTLTLGVT